MRKIHVTRQFFEANGPQVIFSKKKPPQFLDIIRGCVFQISGLYRFLFEQGVSYVPYKIKRTLRLRLLDFDCGIDSR